MGMDPVTIGLLGSAVVGAGSSIFGAKNQQNVNNANLSAQQKQQQMMQGLVQGQMQQGQNPYSSAIMQFLGQGSNPQYAFGGGQQQVPPNIRSPGSQQTNLGDANPGFDQFVNSGFDMNGVQQQFQNGGFSGGGQQGLSDYGGMGGQGQQMPGQGMGQMYQYNQNTPAAQYNAMQSQNPLMGAAPQSFAAQVARPGQLTAQTVGGTQFNAPPPGLRPVGDVSAPTIQMPGGINLPQVGAPNQVSFGSSGYNTGQDALMQMMRQNVSAPRDASIDPMLQMGTQQFDVGALAGQDRQQLDEQVNQLRGSSGSFGQRFGSQMMKQEGTMREQFANNIAARNAGLAQQGFESQQGRQLQAAGIQTGREQFFGQQPFQNAQLQQGAAQAVQQGGLQFGGQDLGAQQFNVNANQGAQQFNAQNAINASLATQGLQTQVGTQNAANQLQAGLANQGTQASQAALLAQLQGQQGQFNAGQNMNMAQFNANQQNQAGQFNIQNQMNANQYNAGNQQQTNLANMGMQGQYGLAGYQGALQNNQYNSGQMNQAGQFNASMQQNQNQFGAQQGNIYNQLIMSGLMNAAGLQNQQQGQNNSLLGILGGVGVPQQQMNPMYGAIGDASQQAMMMPMLMQMMQGQGNRGGQTNTMLGNLGYGR